MKEKAEGGWREEKVSQELPKSLVGDSVWNTGGHTTQLHKKGLMPGKKVTVKD